jgi:hypothetical protein
MITTFSDLNQFRAKMLEIFLETKAMVYIVLSAVKAPLCNKIALFRFFRRKFKITSLTSSDRFIKAITAPRLFWVLKIIKTSSKIFPHGKNFAIYLG